MLRCHRIITPLCKWSWATSRVAVGAPCNYQLVSKFSQSQSQQSASRKKNFRNQGSDQQSSRQKIIVASTALTFFFISNAVLLWRRRKEYDKANKATPPISLLEFRDKYLVPGRVNFDTLDVYLNDQSPQTVRDKAVKKFLKTFSTGPEKFAAEPDVRVEYRCSHADVEAFLREAQREIKGPSEIVLTANTFPNPGELAFVTAATFAAVVVAAVVV